jgi:hypothetical protein
VRYDDSKYLYDKAKKFHQASFEEGAMLYRLTTEIHSGQQNVLSGRATASSRSYGRFHAPQQPTSYCANNVLTTIAEVLFHDYRRAVGLIERRQSRKAIRGSCMGLLRHLHVISVKSIPGLVYTDADDVVELDNRLCGSATVFPEPIYQFFLDFNNKVRSQPESRGILYPSARHSEGLCVALFNDETDKIQEMAGLDVYLSLLPEDGAPGDPPPDLFDPFRQKLHPTMGHYQFKNPLEFERLKRAGLIHPYDLPSRGQVDFVRRKYKVYPEHAVIISGGGPSSNGPANPPVGPAAGSTTPSMGPTS